MGLLEGFATYDAGITKVLADWEKMGIFSYVLPFILIFAVTYAILDKVEVFKGKKGINLVIALAVGLLSLQLNFVAVFFREIFPRAGIGLSVLLVALILAGAFVNWDKGKEGMWIFFGVGAVTFLFILAQAFSAYSGYTTNWWEDYGSAIIILILVIVMIVLAMTMGGEKSGK